MGIDLGDLVVKTPLTFEQLSGKSIAIDAYNTLYQFLAIIRGPSGEPLKDRAGRITSHLSGLLYRSCALMSYGIRLVYVFDGKPPTEKEMEIKRRMKIKEEAAVRYEEALKVGDFETARKYAQATAVLKDEMVGDAKKLISLLGIPWVQAPSEGEAQASHMAFKGHVWAVASQDHDCLLFGAPRLVRNIAVTGRRKLPGRKLYVELQPELIELEKVLKANMLTREQLIDIAILIGTDYNPDGVKGVGPKKGLKLIKEYGSLKALLNEQVIDSSSFPVDPEIIKKKFLNPDVTSDYELVWEEPKVSEVLKFLCYERDFSESRVKNALDQAIKAFKERYRQKRLFSI
ncbi:flap endonuclease-1 [Candidatus Bathyarchaeota archaeon]|nr:flap endonuclease-1 [Candidatus Bathyarchaeota archaeon]MBS7613113.1 flap endonuclease-1 [Candidatus Bathyarchaeota archaeon]MBS7618303.1 flap endonuclease-1 [Candidatus Bathyarchaeota archaeon]